VLVCRRLSLTNVSDDFGTTDVDGEFMVSSGKFCRLFDPCVDDVDITVIRHALSNLCRFNGHTSEFYSVAQHSVLVSHHVPEEDQLHALLHDASEAYLGDIIRPIKYSHEFSFYRHTEKLWQRTIFQKFGLPEEMPESVKIADNRILMTEFRDLFVRTPGGLDQSVEPYSYTINPLSPKEAGKLFQDRWNYLWAQFH